jgi:hypothetical protein
METTGFEKLLSRFSKIWDVPEVSVREVNDLAGSAYGIHLKRENEYGRYSVFHADDGQIYESY